MLCFSRSLLSGNLYILTHAYTGNLPAENQQLLLSWTCCKKLLVRVRCCLSSWRLPAGDLYIWPAPLYGISQSSSAVAKASRVSMKVGASMFPIIDIIFPCPADLIAARRSVTHFNDPASTASLRGLLHRLPVMGGKFLSVIWYGMLLGVTAAWNISACW